MTLPDERAFHETGLPSIRYGGDYSPEHWPIEKVDEDTELMRRAGVNLVSVGIFGWATAEPTRDAFDFSFYRHVLDRLHANGIGVCLATMTASPPPWLTHRHPEMLPQRADGVTLSPGARQQYCPSSPVFRGAVGSFVGALGAELGDHPGTVGGPASWTPTRVLTSSSRASCSIGTAPWARTLSRPPRCTLTVI